MKWKKIFVALISVVVIDQLTKQLVTGKQYSLLGFPIIKYTENTGAAFSILEGYRWLFIIVSLLALAVLFYSTKRIREEQKGIQVVIGVLMGGITGNLIDRIFWGYVRDFINLEFWPIFNLADSAMFIAVIIISVYLIRKK